MAANFSSNKGGTADACPSFHLGRTGIFSLLNKKEESALKNIGIIGAGSIAEAMISGLVHEGMYEPNRIYVSNKSNVERLSYLNEKYQVNVSFNKQEIFRNVDFIILSMKPKDAQEALCSIKQYINSNHLVISVLAGISTTAIEEMLGENIPVIRAMPNTSASIRLSATAIAKGTYATDEHLFIAKKLFEAIGIVEIVEEEQLDAVTGLAGSGPAYIYYLVEAMERAAKEIGLEGDTARSFIIQTLCGASEMLKKSNKEASILRKEVTSPGGTTEAGIKVLESNGFEETIVECVKRAKERSNELKLSFQERLLKERA